MQGLNFLLSFIYKSREIQQKIFFLRGNRFQNFLRSAVVLSERELEEMPPMLQNSVNSAQSAGFNPNMTASVSSPTLRAQQETQYDLKPVSMMFTHPLILESPCNQESSEVDEEGGQLRAELMQLFPEDSRLWDVLLPILQGENLTERRRLQIEACLKFPHVIDVQEAYVKRALGEELTDFEELLLRRMDGAVDCSP